VNGVNGARSYSAYYSNTDVIFLGLGASLIVLGFLIRDWRKK